MFEFKKHGSESGSDSGYKEQQSKDQDSKKQQNKNQNNKNQQNGNNGGGNQKGGSNVKDAKLYDLEYANDINKSAKYDQKADVAEKFSNAYEKLANSKLKEKEISDKLSKAGIDPKDVLKNLDLQEVKFAKASENNSESKYTEADMQRAIQEALKSFVNTKEGSIAIENNNSSTTVEQNNLVEQTVVPVEVANNPEVQKTAWQNVKGWFNSHPRLSSFLTGMAGGMAVRTAAKATVYAAFGANLPATIAAGAIGGGVWEGIRKIREEAVTYQSTEILKRFNALGENNHLEKAAMVAQLEELMKTEKLGGNQTDFAQLREAVIKSRTELQVELDKADGKFANFNDKDKMLYLLNLSKGVRGGIDGTARGKEAQKAMKDILSTLDHKREYGNVFKNKKSVVALSMLRGAAYGALGGAIGGALVNGVGEAWHWFSGAGAAKSAAVDVWVDGGDHASVIKNVYDAKPSVKGLTGASRDALHQYLTDYAQTHPGLSEHLSGTHGVEKLVYAEDYLKDHLIAKGASPDKVLHFSRADLEEALMKSGILEDEGKTVLTDHGVSHINQLISHRPHFLSEATKQYMLDFPQGSTQALEHYQTIIQETLPQTNGESWISPEAFPAMVGLLGAIGLTELGVAAGNVNGNRKSNTISEQYFTDARNAENNYKIAQARTGLNTTGGLTRPNTPPTPHSEYGSFAGTIEKIVKPADKTSENSAAVDNNSSEGSFLGLDKNNISSESVKNNRNKSLDDQNENYPSEYPPEDLKEQRQKNRNDKFKTDNEGYNDLGSAITSAKNVENTENKSTKAAKNNEAKKEKLPVKEVVDKNKIDFSKEPKILKDILDLNININLAESYKTLTADQKESGLKNLADLLSGLKYFPKEVEIVVGGADMKAQYENAGRFVFLDITKDAGKLSGDFYSQKRIAEKQTALIGNVIVKSIKKPQNFNLESNDDSEAKPVVSESNSANVVKPVTGDEMDLGKKKEQKSNTEEVKKKNPKTKGKPTKIGSSLQDLKNLVEDDSNNRESENNTTENSSNPETQSEVDDVSLDDLKKNIEQIKNSIDLSRLELAKKKYSNKKGEPKQSILKLLTIDNYNNLKSKLDSKGVDELNDYIKYRFTEALEDLSNKTYPSDTDIQNIEDLYNSYIKLPM